MADLMWLDEVNRCFTSCLSPKSSPTNVIILEPILCRIIKFRKYLESRRKHDNTYVYIPRLTWEMKIYIYKWSAHYQRSQGVTLIQYIWFMVLFMIWIGSFGSYTTLKEGISTKFVAKEIDSLKPWSWVLDVLMELFLSYCCMTPWG